MSGSTSSPGGCDWCSVGRDLVLSPGEVVEFDTRTPHWVGNPGPEPAEALAIYGPQGERMHVRA
ncbi:MAG: cupin domain-containing protein [Nocardioidaceae bacterium]